MQNRLSDQKAIRNSVPVFQHDGQNLFWEEYGDSSRKPVFFFHGWPGSHLQAFILSKRAEELGVRLIAPDRPGMGGSTIVRHRRLLDWPSTITALADFLGISTFSILAVSGGGAYAFACARVIPFRLEKVGVCSGVPYSNWLREDRTANSFLSGGVKLHDRLPQLGNPAFRMMRAMVLGHASVRNVRRLLFLLPPADQEFLKQTDILEGLVASTKESYRQSAEGVYQDIRLITSDWGFESAEVCFPILWWHGDVDEVCPIDSIRRVAARNQFIKLTEFPNEGHYSLSIGKLENLLTELFR
jgi:pimeloyl-ACP methyl ester carboxylesterase